MVTRLPEASYTSAMRIVGNQNRSEIERDPVKAYQRGLLLDAMMRGTLPPYPRGVTRGTHEYFNRIDAVEDVIGPDTLRWTINFSSRKSTVHA